MALVTCKICKKEVIETADKCPHCDSLGPRKNRRVMWMMAGLVVILAGAMSWMVYNRSQEKTRTREEIDAARLAEKIHQRVMSATFLLKTSFADPASIRVDDVRTNVDGSVLCYQYSAKGSKGAQEKKKAVFAEGNFHYSGGSWSIYCDSKSITELPEKPPPLD